MFSFIKKLFGTKIDASPAEENEVKELVENTKSKQKRLEPKSLPIGNGSSKKYNPNKKTIFPIDLNAKNMEALDAICLLAGFDHKDNKWTLKDSDFELDRLTLATIEDDLLDKVNEYSLFTKVTYVPTDSKREKLFTFSEAYQNKLLALQEMDSSSKIEIGDTIIMKGSPIMDLKMEGGLDPLEYSVGDRVALLGMNLQLRYIFDIVGHNRTGDGLLGDMVGIHTRAPRVRSMYMVKL